MMDDYSALTSLMERIIHKYNQWEGKKRAYGTELLLTRSEIHTVAAIGDHEGINVTALAHVRGVTKAAASQMVYKLVGKGLVEKRVSPHSDTEVTLRLTEEGEKNYTAHKEIHTQSGDEALKLFHDLPAPFYHDMLQFLTAFDEIMDNKLREK